MTTETVEKKQETGTLIERMFSVGAHFGYSKKRRHPSVRPFIFGMKGTTEIINLEKTEELLAEAKEYVHSLGRERKVLLFVGGKHEARDVIRTAGEKTELPFVAGRWIGGTITNFSEIKKRIEKLETLLEQKEKGTLEERYTKKELLLISREIEKLKTNFEGLIPMKEKLPDALFVVDPHFEDIAVEEANRKSIPIIALANSDCNLEKVTYPIVANDGTVESINFFTQVIREAYEAGAKEAPVKKEEDKKEEK
ncbi:MAG: 30S ribosomal protein S2 [Candidatus Paceibacterota bacterium]